MNATAAFGLFSYLWALSALFDLIPRAAWFDSPAHSLLAVCAVFLVLRPTSIAGFALFNVMRLAAFVQDSPNTPNHQVLFSLASATILFSALPILWRERKASTGGERLDPQSWLAAFSPILRVLLVVMYGLAVLHKLNWAYFDPSVSCAVSTFARLAPGWLDRLYPDGAAAAYLLIFGSLAAEASVPVLLCFRSTRLFGIAAGVLFHCFLGLGYFHFSTGLFAVYSLFIPLAASTAAAQRISAWRDRAVWRKRVATPTCAGLAGLALVAAMVVLREVDRPSYRLLRYVWMAGMLGGFAVLVRAPAEWPRWREALHGRLGNTRLGFVFPVALVFVGMSPYLGLRTVPAFSMFSNLRTEGGVSNHLFMPATALHLARYQDDLVQVDATNRQALDQWARKGRLRTFYDLRSEVQRLVREERDHLAGRPEGAPPIYLQLERAGTRHTLRNAGANPEIMAEISWLERKWMKFRPVPGERQACTW